ncbi:Uncharacterised protein [Salmonella enterica subsp. arizonae]|nr:Uncharacterised protein [Salmonella enterica subsp. arizonae]
MNNLMPSSPSSQASSSKAVTDTFMPPDEIINETLISLFYLTSEGGFMSKDTRIVNHRELNKKFRLNWSLMVVHSGWMRRKSHSGLIKCSNAALCQTAPFISFQALMESSAVIIGLNHGKKCNWNNTMICPEVLCNELTSLLFSKSVE